MQISRFDSMTKQSHFQAILVNIQKNYNFLDFDLEFESLILGGNVPGLDKERQVCTSPLTLCPSKLNTLLALSN